MAPGTFSTLVPPACANYGFQARRRRGCSRISSRTTHDTKNAPVGTCLPAPRRNTTAKPRQSPPCPLETAVTTCLPSPSSRCYPCQAKIQPRVPYTRSLLTASSVAGMSIYSSTIASMLPKSSRVARETRTMPCTTFSTKERMTQTARPGSRLSYGRVPISFAVLPHNVRSRYGSASNRRASRSTTLRP